MILFFPPAAVWEPVWGVTQTHRLKLLHMMESHSRALLRVPLPSSPIRTVISHSHPSLPPFHTQPLNFSLGLCVQPSGLSPLHHSSHYLSVSFLNDTQWPAISSWHLDILPAPSPPVFLFTYTADLSLFSLFLSLTSFLLICYLYILLWFLSACCLDFDKSSASFLLEPYRKYVYSLHYIWLEFSYCLFY